MSRGGHKPCSKSPHDKVFCLTIVSTSSCMVPSQFTTECCFMYEVARPKESSGVFSRLIGNNHTPSNFGAATRSSHSACCTLLVPTALFGGWPGDTHSEVLRLGGSLHRADIVTPRPGDGGGTDGSRSTSNQRRSFGLSVDRCQCLLEGPSASWFVVRYTGLFVLVWPA